MFSFTNPNIIISYNDAVLGTVISKKPEISFLDFIALVEYRVLSKVMAGVKENMSENLDHAAAVQEVLHLVKSYLTFDNLLDAYNEQQIAEKIFTSQEYVFWKSSMYYRFMNLHKGVITEKTPIRVDGKNDVYEDMGIEETDFIDILESLSSVNKVQP